MKTIKNYTLISTCGAVRHHAGYSPTEISSGEVSAEIISAGYYTPEMTWSPNPSLWEVRETIPYPVG